jgi:DNA-binding IclR family transcriptional regulator
MTLDPFAPLSWDDPLPPEATRVLGYLRVAGGGVSLPQLARTLSFAESTVAAALAPLLDRRLVARVSSGRFRAVAWSA